MSGVGSPVLEVQKDEESRDESEGVRWRAEDDEWMNGVEKAGTVRLGVRERLGSLRLEDGGRWVVSRSLQVRLLAMVSPEVHRSRD